MARYACIKAGIVGNVVIGDAAFAAAIASQWDQVVELTDGVSAGPGDTFAAGVFARSAPPVVVPEAVTMRQARLALFAAGKLADVDAAIDALPEPAKTAARIEWDYSNELQRGNPLVAALTPALGLTSEHVDALFIAASAL